jgi:hypothetical protein
MDTSFKIGDIVPFTDGDLREVDVVVVVQGEYLIMLAQTLQSWAASTVAMEGAYTKVKEQWREAGGCQTGEFV